MAVCSSKDLGDQPGEFLDGHMLAEAMIVDPVGALMSIVDDGWIFRIEALPATSETCSLRIEVESIGSSEDSTGCIGPAILIISSLF